MPRVSSPVLVIHGTEDEVSLHLSIKLLESPIPAATATTATAASSQKAHFDNISGTKRGTIDPLVSK